jgi:hypothetical protein
MLRVNAVATDAPNIPNNGKRNPTKVLQGANHCTFPNLRSSLCKCSAIVREVGDPLHNAKDLNAVEDDNFVMFDKTLYPMAMLVIRTSPTKLKRRKVPISVCWICVWNCSSCKQTHWVQIELLDSKDSYTVLSKHSLS